MPMFPPNADPAYRRHFSENIKQHLPLPMIGNEFVKVYTRCRYWPRCSNRKCKFVHPVYDCKFDKDCPYDTLCAFRHSSDPVPDNLTGYYRGRRKSKIAGFSTSSKLPPPANEECINLHTEPDREPESGPEPQHEPEQEPDAEHESVGYDTSSIIEIGPTTPKPSPRFNPRLLSPKMKWAKPSNPEYIPEASSLITPTAVKTDSVSLALMFQDHELPTWPIERYNYATSFPNSMFLSNFMAQKQTATSSSLNFEDCGALMSWTNLQENITLGPSLTVASMKKIWQDTPNSYSRHELAR